MWSNTKRVMMLCEIKTEIKTNFCFAYVLVNYTIYRDKIQDFTHQLLISFSGRTPANLFVG